MKRFLCLFTVSLILLSCGTETKSDNIKTAPPPLIGTWQLISGTLIEKGDTTVTDYTKGQSFIKIINDSHFAFLKHNLDKTKDTAGAFVAGGGRYTLKENNYTEHLEYCNDRQWEGNDFSFTISIKDDTLVQTGIEKVENAGVNRLNIEKYKRVQH